MCYILIFSFGTGLALKSNDYKTFPVSLWLTCGLLLCIGAVCQRYTVYIGEPVRFPIIQFIVFHYRGIYYVDEPS